MVEQGAGRSMAKGITAENARARLRHAVGCPNMMGRSKDRIAQNKRARASSLAILDKPQMVGTCIFRAIFLPIPFCVSLALFFFVFVFYFNRGPSSNRALI